MSLMSWTIDINLYSHDASFLEIQELQQMIHVFCYVTLYQYFLASL
jgi:hypothetical protein